MRWVCLKLVTHACIASKNLLRRVFATARLACASALRDTAVSLVREVTHPMPTTQLLCMLRNSLSFTLPFYLFFFPIDATLDDLIPATSVFSLLRLLRAWILQNHCLPCPRQRWRHVRLPYWCHLMCVRSIVRIASQLYQLGCRRHPNMLLR